MTKPILYLMLLTGGAFAAGAGVVTYGEWQEARRTAASAATGAPVQTAPSEAAPDEALAAQDEPPAAAEESLATPLDPPSAPAASAASQPETPDSEVAAAPPQPEAAAAEEMPQAPPATPDTAVAEGPDGTPEAGAQPDGPRLAARPSAPEAAGEGASPAPVRSPAVEEPVTEPRRPSDSAALQRDETPAAPSAAAAPPQPAESAALQPEAIPAAPPAAAEPPAAAPSFDIVRVEPTGEAVIAGQAPRGARVQVLSNEEVVAETSADQAGNWVALPERPLRPGSHDLTIRAMGEAGEATPSEQHVAIAVPEAPGEEVFAVLGVPGRASEVLAGPSREAQRAPGEPPQKLEPMATAGEVTERRPPVLSVDAVEAEGRNMFVAGAGDPGALVRVYVDGELVGQAEAGAGGRWLVEASRALEEGEVTVRADQLKAGTARVEARAEVPFVRRLDMAALVPAARTGAGAGDSAEGEALPQPGAVIIRRGDNLWTISRRTYGRGFRYTTIYRANENQIRDPHWIYPGQVFVLPSGDRAWAEE